MWKKSIFHLKQLWMTLIYEQLSKEKVRNKILDSINLSLQSTLFLPHFCLFVLTPNSATVFGVKDFFTKIPPGLFFFFLFFSKLQVISYRIGNIRGHFTINKWESFLLIIWLLRETPSHKIGAWHTFLSSIVLTFFWQFVQWRHNTRSVMMT